MKAEEAKKLMLTKTVNMDYVLKSIEGRASSGYSYSLFWEYLSDDLIKALIELGYSVRRVDGPAKEKLVEVSWI